MELVRWNGLGGKFLAGVWEALIMNSSSTTGLVVLSAKFRYL
jgi:hypothetical protein